MHSLFTNPIGVGRMFNGGLAERNRRAAWRSQRCRFLQTRHRRSSLSCQFASAFVCRRAQYAHDTRRCFHYNGAWLGQSIAGSARRCEFRRPTRHRFFWHQLIGGFAFAGLVRKRRLLVRAPSGQVMPRLGIFAAQPSIRCRLANAAGGRSSRSTAMGTRCFREPVSRRTCCRTDVAPPTRRRISNRAARRSFSRPLALRLVDCARQENPVA